MKHNQNELTNRSKPGEKSTQKPEEIGHKKEINPNNQPDKKSKKSDVVLEPEELDKKSTKEEETSKTTGKSNSR